MPSAELEPAILAIKQLQTYASYIMATGIAFKAMWFLTIDSVVWISGGQAEFRNRHIWNRKYVHKTDSLQLNTFEKFPFAF